MDVSIVIPTKNAGDRFKDVLRAVFDQKTDLEYEVICVDSGSTDDTVEVIKSFSCVLSEIDPPEFGHGKTRNYGASLGSGEFIVFLTQDALPATDTWLDNLVKAMGDDKSVVGGFGIHYPYPDCNFLDNRDISRHFQNFGPVNSIIYIDDWERYRTDSGYYNILSFFSDNNSCLRRSAWEAHPYPDVDFAEDQIWMRQMLELGYKKVYCPTAPVYHSHNYKLKSYFGRAYDEYQAVYHLYNGFLVVPRFRSIPRAVVRETRINYADISRTNLSKSEKVKLSVYCFFRVASKLVGGYLGGKSNLLSEEERLKSNRKYSQQYSQRKG